MARQFNIGFTILIYHLISFAVVSLAKRESIIPEDRITLPGSKRKLQTFNVDVFLCDEDNNKLSQQVDRIYHGIPTRVCVKPDNTARQAGVFMKHLDSFNWSRDDMSQSAIMSADLQPQLQAPFTYIECTRGSIVCAFTTVLKEGFFFADGVVEGTGVAALQFGNTNNGRELRAEMVLSRSLQTKAGEATIEVEQHVKRQHEVISYLCNSQNMAINQKNMPLRKGGTARVCVRPSDVALAQGIKIRSIDSFVWKQARGNFVLSQLAIAETYAAEDDATTVFCTPGAETCVFETVLNEEFYGILSTVNGTGIVLLENESTSRRVQVDLGRTLFSNTGGNFAGATEFAVSVNVLPPMERLLCRAYLCDQNNQPISGGASFYMRMCFEPTTLAKELGATMWMIKNWTWKRKTDNLGQNIVLEKYKENSTQVAIESQGKEAKDGNTLLMCERGAKVCSFETRLSEKFFEEEFTSVVGVGHCWLTFGGGSENFQDEDLDSSDDEIDPNDDPLFAGGGDISLDFAISASYVPPEENCFESIEVEKSIQNWWKYEEQGSKVLYMGLLVPMALTVLCCACCCMAANYRRRQQGRLADNVNVKVDNSESRSFYSRGGYGPSSSVGSLYSRPLYSLPIPEASEDYPEQNSYNNNYGNGGSGWGAPPVAAIATGGGYDNGRSSDKRSKKSSNSSSSRSLFYGDIRAKDVSIGDDFHPGTIKCKHVVRKLIAENPDEKYNPEILKEVKKKLGKDAKFLVAVQDEDDSSLEEEEDAPRFREAKKKEIVQYVGEIWLSCKKQKQKLNRSASERFSHSSRSQRSLSPERPRSLSAMMAPMSPAMTVD